MEKELTVFYSWQSGPHDKENRYLIQDCLRAAAKKLATEGIAVRIEQDTRGEDGSVDIPQALFEKIESADLFVGDITTINPAAEGERKTPNPNVMIEMGFAARSLGWERVLAVCNTRFGRLEEAPFDIRHRRIIAYSAEGPDESTKKRLTERLTQAMRNASARRLPAPQIESAKALLAELLYDGLRYAWHEALPEKKEPEGAGAVCYGAEDETPRAPVIIEMHLREVSHMNSVLTKEELTLLIDLLDTMRYMRHGTDDAYGEEFAAQLAGRCFESVWMEYRGELATLTMEQCLRKEIVDLLNHLLPQEQQIDYRPVRTDKSGAVAFISDGRHLEAYSKSGDLLIKADLDDEGKITGWKSSPSYAGDYVHGRREGTGTEYARSFHHIGEARRTGTWKSGKFTGGTVYGAVLSKDDTAEDGFAVESLSEGVPMQLCGDEANFLLRELMPDECMDIYTADLQMSDETLDIIGTPEPLCRRKGGRGLRACTDCPHDELQ